MSPTPAAGPAAILATLVAAVDVPGAGGDQMASLMQLAGASIATQDGILARLGPGQRLVVTLLWSELGLVAPARLRQLLARYWGFDSCGVPAELGGPLVHAFRLAGFVTDTPGTAPPTTPLRLYRGVRRSNEPGLGMSWTTDPAVAAEFAQPRHPHEAGAVSTAEVPPAGVLAIFHAAGDHEVVVDPVGLRNLKRIAS